MRGSLKGPDLYLLGPKLASGQKVSEHVFCDRPELIPLLYMWDFLDKPCGY